MAQQTERAVLNHLIETCRDGQRGFLSAASHVENPALKTLFEQMAKDRGRFADTLTPHAQRLGGESGTDGSSAAALHRRNEARRSALSADASSRTGWTQRYRSSLTDHIRRSQ